jgi:hypothetical protein
MARIVATVLLEQSERETHMCALANRLEFAVQKVGHRFTLVRTADVTAPVCEDRLTLDQAEGLVETWKLHGHE